MKGGVSASGSIGIERVELGPQVCGRVGKSALQRRALLGEIVRSQLERVPVGVLGVGEVAGPAARGDDERALGPQLAQPPHEARPTGDDVRDDDAAAAGDQWADEFVVRRCVHHVTRLTRRPGT